MMTWLPWLLAGAGLVIGLLLYARLRTLALESASRQIDNEKLHGELQATRAQLEKSAAKQRRGSDELADLRKRLDKAKRRAAGVQPAASESASRMQELSVEIESTRQARDAARHEASEAREALARLRAEHSAPAAPAVPPRDEGEIAALERRASDAEARAGELAGQLAETNRKLEDERKSSERLKRKLKTQDDVYMQLRGELEAKKDRLRTQQESLERLQALKVAVLDPLPPDRNAAAASEAVDPGAEADDEREALAAMDAADDDDVSGESGRDGVA